MKVEDDTIEIPSNEAGLFMTAVVVSMSALCYAIVLALSSISIRSGTSIALLWLISWPLIGKAFHSLAGTLMGKWATMLASRALMVFLGLINGMSMYQCALIVGATLLTWSSRRRMHGLLYK